MLTGLLTAGTATLNGECGEIDTGLVEGAPLAFPPQEVGMLSQAMPVFGIGEFLARCCRAGIGCHTVHLISGNLYTHCQLPVLYLGHLPIYSYEAIERW